MEGECLSSTMEGAPRDLNWERLRVFPPCASRRTPCLRRCQQPTLLTEQVNLAAAAACVGGT